MSPRRAAALRDTTDIGLREHLIATAAAVLAEHGAAGATVRDIARAAGVATGALYNHFADKEELLALGLAEHVRTVRAGLGAPPEPGTATVAENLAAYVDRTVELHAGIAPAFAAMIGKPAVTARFEKLTAARPAPVELEGYLHAEQELGRIAVDVDIATATTLLIGACHEQVFPTMLQSPVERVTVPAGFAERLAATVLRGIAP